MLIHNYAEDGNIAGVRDELAKNVDIETRGERDGYTPLMHAVNSANAHRDMVRFLIENGANPNVVGGLRRTKNHVLSLAVKSGDPDKIVTLLDSGADIGYESPSRYGALIDAAYGANYVPDRPLASLLRLLIDRGAKLDTVTEYGESAINVASMFGRFDAVQVLLDAGSDPSPLVWTPLMRAVALGTLGDVQAELERADLAARDSWDRTPWLLSLQVGDVAKAKLLRAAGANPYDRGRRDEAPLVYPIANGHHDMLAWLLSEGLNPDDTDNVGRTPLMEAASNGETECVKFLMKAGASIHLADKYDHTAIALASNLDIVRLLVNAGADLNEINSEMRVALTKLPGDGRIDASREEYLAAKHRQFGTTNPEKMNYPFWKAMIRAGAGAWSARDRFDDHNENDEPVWCFMRFGKSINELPDGRIIEIAGEHEDFYDPDFCIYNDVIVHSGDGTFDIYGYPKAVFPPTDFHTATLVGKFIYIIGSIGYRGARRYAITPVHRLDIDTLAIEEVRTSGDSPGWIGRHKATLRENEEIHVSGGKACARNADEEGYIDNPFEYVLSLNSLVWHKLPHAG
ncbi:MAG: ankyrin repeat domain-containing protein [Thermoguttaceae bacterium]